MFDVKCLQAQLLRLPREVDGLRGENDRDERKFEMEESPGQEGRGGRAGGNKPEDEMQRDKPSTLTGQGGREVEHEEEREENERSCEGGRDDQDGKEEKIKEEEGTGGRG
jgi:hypothetical protein